MEDLFFEYYPIKEEEVKGIWDICLFTYDTNVLLNFYRYTDNTTNKFCEVIEKLNARNILTYHSAFEFHKNRLTTIFGQIKAYDILIEFLNKKFNEIDNELNRYKKHTYIRSTDIKIKYERTFNKINKDIKKLKSEHPDWIQNDLIRDKITDLFRGRVTKSYDEKTLSEIYKDGKIRYEKEVPPGYEDFKEKKDKDECSLYGDLIIWNQLMDISKEKSLPIVFVTDDLKDDWWYRFNGKTIGPRPELLKEFNIKTNQKILIYNADSFLGLASEYMGINVDRKVVKEIEDLRIKDESLINSFKLNETYARLVETLNKQSDIMKKWRESARVSEFLDGYKTTGSVMNSIREKFENDRTLYEHYTNPFANLINNEDFLKSLNMKLDESGKAVDNSNEE
jgi:hypothetical protein